MVGYERSVAMKERAMKKYAEGKLTESGFITEMRKAGFGDIKAREFLKKAEAYKKQYETDKENIAKEKATKTKAAADIKKKAGGVPTVDEVMAKPEKGTPILGGHGKSRSGKDSKPILTVKDALSDFDPDKSVLGNKKIIKATSITEDVNYFPY